MCPSETQCPMADDRRPSGRQCSTVDVHEDDDRIFSFMRFGQLSCFSLFAPGFRSHSYPYSYNLSPSLSSVSTHRTHASRFIAPSLHRYVLLYPTLAIDIVSPRANHSASFARSVTGPATHVAIAIVNRAPATYRTRNLDRTIPHATRSSGYLHTVTSHTTSFAVTIITVTASRLRHHPTHPSCIQPWTYLTVYRLPAAASTLLINSHLALATAAHHIPTPITYIESFSFSSWSSLRIIDIKERNVIY